MMSACFCQKIPPPPCQTLSEIIRPSSYMTSESSQPLPLQKQNKNKTKQKNVIKVDLKHNFLFITYNANYTSLKESKHHLFSNIFKWSCWVVFSSTTLFLSPLLPLCSSSSPSSSSLTFSWLQLLSSTGFSICNFFSSILFALFYPLLGLMGSIGQSKSPNLCFVDKGVKKGFQISLILLLIHFYPYPGELVEVRIYCANREKITIEEYMLDLLGRSCW